MIFIKLVLAIMFLSFILPLYTSAKLKSFFNSTIKNFIYKSSLSNNDLSTISLKSVGKKNEFSSGEKLYFENLLNNEYRIIKQMGKSGDSSSAYLIKDRNNEKYILKLPSRPNMKNWKIDQLKMFETVDNIFREYTGKVNIPKYIKYGENFIIEKYLGEDLTVDLYESLTDEEKDDLAKDLSDIILFLHSKSDKSKIAPINIPSFFSLEDCLDYLKPALSDKQFWALSNLINQFNNRNVSDEWKVLIHFDLRIQNVLYDTANKTLALIDFECLRYDNIYYDFCPRIGPRISHNLLVNTIKYYNNKSPYKIDLNKVDLFHKIFSIYEFCTCMKFRDNINSIQEIKSNLTMIEKNFPNIFD